jgi:hypothetical protein
MGTIQTIIDRAASEPEFVKRLVADPIGTVTSEGYTIDAAELRSLLDMPDADPKALQDAVQERLAHSGSTRSVQGIIPPNGGG